MNTSIVVTPSKKFSGELSVPGDKSISHRAVLLGSLAMGKTRIYNFLRAEDCISTINCMRSLGVNIFEDEECIIIDGKGLYLQPSCLPLDAGNSGTTARLLLGILAGQRFGSQLTGDESLCRRPMLRVTEPLRCMGAEIEGEEGANRLPLTIKPGELKPLNYELPVASAQVKSAVLLAGLFARGETSVSESLPARDHTERMLELFGAEIERDKPLKTVKGPASLVGCRIKIPGDISSAAFFMVAAAIIPGADVVIRGVGINPTRTGVIDILDRMGANLSILKRPDCGNEPVCDIRILGTGKLKAVTIGGDIIPRLIDEIPILAVAALVAHGTTIIKDAGELRVKESDRILLLARELSRMGAKIEEKQDGLRIEGGNPLKGCECQSHGDHRLAMSLAIAGLIASGETRIKGANSINISYPSFINDIKHLTG